MLNGGVLVQLKIPDAMDSSGIQKTIEKAGEILGSFRPVKKVSICSNCGLEEEKLQKNILCANHLHPTGSSKIFTMHCIDKN